MTVRYTGMNPDGTGTLTDAAHVGFAGQRHQISND